MDIVDYIDIAALASVVGAAGLITWRLRDWHKTSHLGRDLPPTDLYIGQNGQVSEHPWDSRTRRQIRERWGDGAGVDIGWDHIYDRRPSE